MAVVIRVGVEGEGEGVDNVEGGDKDNRRETR